MNGYVHGVEVADLPFAFYNLILIAVWLIAAGLSAWGGIAIWFRWKKELAAPKASAQAESQAGPQSEDRPEVEISEE